MDEKCQDCSNFNIENRVCNVMFDKDGHNINVTPQDGCSMSFVPRSK